MRPLAGIPSLKLKLGLVIVAAVGVSAIVSTLGVRAGVPTVASLAIGVAASLGLVQVLAKGMTSPLREMAVAAAAMARGDYGKRVTVTSRDEVGALATAFNAMAAELAEADRARRDLVANVSHELRTPITALQANLENLADGVIAPDDETVRTMLAQVDRLGRLVTQLLDLSRLESGVVPLEREPFDVARMLEQAVAESRLHAPGVGVDLDVHAGTPKADGDAERVHQVVANLLENAVRFSPPGEPVTVTARGDGRDVVIEVSDAGPGIPDDQRERVFERFYRADAARSRSDGGAGLGLAIARWIVDLHGGRIAAEARTPTGCRMVVRLPAA